MLTFLYAIFAFIVGLGALIIVHEAGHFLTARACGVRVLVFSIGFGRKLCSFFDKKNTEYRIALIPLGGFVKMLDEREAPVPAAEQAYAFNRAKLWKKLSIVLAGPLANFLFSIIAYTAILMIGTEVLIPVIGEVTPHSIAAQAQIKPNEEIVQIGEINIQSWQDVMLALISHSGGETTIVVKDHVGQVAQRELDLRQWQPPDEETDPFAQLGIEPKYTHIPAVVGVVSAGEPAEKAGLKAADKILAADAHPIKKWDDFVKYTRTHANQVMQLTILREGKTLVLPVTPVEHADLDGKKYGKIGIEVKMVNDPGLHRIIKASPMIALKKAVIKTYEMSYLTLKLLFKMITGNVSLSHLSGPIAIAKGAGVSLQSGLIHFLDFLAIISVSLGVLNLLPIPVLDGGHFVLYTLESVRRKPFSNSQLSYFYQVGFGILFTLMFIAFYNDISRL